MCECLLRYASINTSIWSYERFITGTVAGTLAADCLIALLPDALCWVKVSKDTR